MAKLEPVISELQRSAEPGGPLFTMQPFSIEDGTPDSKTGALVTYRGVDFIVIKDFENGFAVAAKAGAPMPCQLYIITTSY